jgi:hypothetical protein
MLETFSKQTERGRGFLIRGKARMNRNRNRASIAQNVQPVLAAMISISPGAHTPAADPGAAPVATRPCPARPADGSSARTPASDNGRERTLSLFAEVGTSVTRGRGVRTRSDASLTLIFVSGGIVHVAGCVVGAWTPGLSCPGGLSNGEDRTSGAETRSVRNSVRNQCPENRALQSSVSMQNRLP